MASYHLSAQIIRRSAGHSAVAAAAYRAGEKLKDERTGRTHDYSKRGGVAHSEIMCPEGAAECLKNREILWNMAEGMENRKDAQTAREINMALPHELNEKQRLALVREFVTEHFVNQGMVADVAIHYPQIEKGDSPQNHHAHVLLTLRQATRFGLRTTKTREWNSTALLKTWRESWADYQNNALGKYGHKDRVDHRTLKDQKQEAEEKKDWKRAVVLDREPEIHVGAKARQISRMGKVPQSYDALKAVYSSKRQDTPYRTRSYTKTDKGSRVVWNNRIITRNRQRFGRYLTHWSRQQARFRRHAMHYGKIRKQSHARKRLGATQKILKGLSFKLSFGRSLQSTLSLRAIDYRLRYYYQGQKKERGQGRKRSGDFSLFPTT